MVVGEAEIQGQVKRAYERALAARTTGPLTNRLFHAAWRRQARAHRDDDLDRERLGRLGRGRGGAVAGRRAGGAPRVIVGAGETPSGSAHAFHLHGVTTMFVANRRRDRAIALAQRFGGSSGSFDALPEELERADVVVTSTASPHAIIGPEELSAVMEARGGRPLLLVDLAVPRDIDPLAPRVAGRDAARHGCAAGPGARASRRPPHRGGARGGDRRGGDPDVRGLARPARGAADADRAARARGRDRGRAAGRERRALGRR